MITLCQINNEINAILERKFTKNELVSFNYILKILSSYFPITKINIEKKGNKFNLFVCSKIVSTFLLKQKKLAENRLTYHQINLEFIHNGFTEDSTNEEIVKTLSSEWNERRSRIALESKKFTDFLKKFPLDIYDFNIIIKEYDNLDFLTKEYLKNEALLENTNIFIKKDENAEF